MLLATVTCGAALGLGWFANARVPLTTWLLWPYAGFWAATLLWLLCCVSVGHAALRLLPALRLRFRQRLLFDLALGVLILREGLFLLGLFGLLRSPFFYLYPLALGAIGFPGLARDLARARRHFRAARARAHRPPSLLLGAAFAFGTLAFAVVYLSIMVPENAAFDARSYHLPIAEHYAAWGRIGRFPEGWFGGVLPHLASWLYTWPFTLRSVNLFGHVELCGAPGVRALRRDGPRDAAPRRGPPARPPRARLLGGVLSVPRPLSLRLEPRPGRRPRARVLGRAARPRARKIPAAAGRSARAACWRV